MKIQNAQVQALLDEIYETHLSIPNFLHFIQGEYRPVNRFPDKSFSALVANKTIRTAFLNKIQQLRCAEKLSNYDRLALNLAENFIDTQMFPVSCLMEDYYYLEFGITPYEFPIEVFWGSLPLFDCSSEENVHKHLELSEDFIRFTKQMRDKVYEQARRGIYLFAEMIPSTCQMLRHYATVEYAKHPFSMIRPASAATKEQIKIESAFIHQANQYLIEIANYLETEEYLGKAPKKPGWGQFERGLEYYRYLRKFHLGYDVDAAELHALGITLLQQAVNKQADIRKRLGYDCTHAEFVTRLRGNERFFPSTPERLGELMNACVDRVARQMGKYFYERIETPYRVMRLDPEMEESLTFGFFQPSIHKEQAGIYFFNGSKLEEKCQLTTPALLAHEVLPGHHFQQSYMNESSELHPLFKSFFSPSCLEGWAEYCGKFLGEVGIFDDYDEYGRLENDKFGCARLIVDTGLNELGWSMEQARSFLVENTFAIESMVISETMRYTYCIPAQCLSYKHGSLKMSELRDRFKTAKDENFDIRDFHSLVLNTGCIPMPLLENYIEQEIQ